MIIIATGISGSGRLKYLEKVCALSDGRLVLRDIGSMMFRKSSELGIEIPGGKILDLDGFALSYLRAAIFEELLVEKEKYKSGDKDLIINTHTCFRWKKHLTPGFNFNYLNRLDPDLYVTMIDDVSRVKARLDNNPHWKDRLTLKDILIWRDEETFITKMIADYQKRPFYLIPTDEPPETLLNIIYEVERKKNGGNPGKIAYLSYPITYARGIPEWMEKKNGLRDLLRKSGLIIFDPMDVKELELLKDLRSKTSKIEVEGMETKVSSGMIKEAVGDMVDQVVYRDYKLIDQSDMIIVFYPSSEAKPILSSGVLSELIYGFTHNKEVFAIFPQKEISPFFDYYTTKVFKSVEELLKYLRSRNYIPN